MAWLILLLVVVVVAAVAAVAYTRTRSARLRQRFGAEYDRAIDEHGDKRKAEAGLRTVAKRRAELNIRPLAAESRDRYVGRWRDAQARFVDAPVRAVAEAEALVGQVLRERGYPSGDFDEQVAMVAADHGDRAEDYRRASAIHRHEAGGDGSTDDLREAFLRFRAVFDALVEDADGGTAPAGGPTTAPVPGHHDDDGDGVDDRDEVGDEAEHDRSLDPTIEQPAASRPDGTRGGVTRLSVGGADDVGRDGSADDDLDDEARRRAEAEMARRRDVEERIAAAREAK
jgi:hypothetical protein